MHQMPIALALIALDLVIKVLLLLFDLEICLDLLSSILIITSSRWDGSNFFPLKVPCDESHFFFKIIFLSLHEDLEVQVLLLLIDLISYLSISKVCL